jgi:glycosyltransferase involved in cell wall biosynthesis
MHASHSHTLGVLAKRIASTDAKFVVTRRVDFPPGQDPINRWKYQKGPDAYIAISQAIQNILVGAGIEKDRVHLAHSGVLPLDIPANSRKDWGKKLDADDDAILIGNVAGLVDHKGHTFLLSAIPQIIEQIPNALFVIAGDGELRQKLETQATALGLTDRNLRFLGHQTAIASLYGAFDIFAMTSHLEGLCTSIIDAQLAQVPVVATDAGGIGELVIHEKTGLLAKSRSPESIAENLIRLCKDPALQKQLAKTAKKTAAAGFTAHAMVQSTLKAYIKILGL